MLKFDWTKSSKNFERPKSPARTGFQKGLWTVSKGYEKWLATRFWPKSWQFFLSLWDLKS